MAFLFRFLKAPSGSFFLFGPRGTGKMTWLRRRLPEALFVNLLRPDVYREMAARPERLRELVRGDSKVRDVVIDEVQRVPELLYVVYDLMEERNAPRFVLTGSSAGKLRHGGVDLLAGRAVVQTMHPFVAAELPKFDLDQALHTGLVPLVVDSPDPTATLSAYAGLYMERWRDLSPSICARGLRTPASTTRCSRGAHVRAWRWILWCTADSKIGPG